MSNEIISESYFEDFDEFLIKFIDKSYNNLKQFKQIYNLFLEKKEQIIEELKKYNYKYKYNPFLLLAYDDKISVLSKYNKLILYYSLINDNYFCSRLVSLEYHNSNSLLIELDFLSQLYQNQNIKKINISNFKNKKNPDFEINLLDDYYTLELTTNLMGKAEEEIRYGFRLFIKELLNKVPEKHYFKIRVSLGKLQKNNHFCAEEIYRKLHVDFKLIEEIIFIKDGSILFNYGQLNDRLIDLESSPYPQFHTELSDRIKCLFNKSVLGEITLSDLANSSIKSITNESFNNTVNFKWITVQSSCLYPTFDEIMRQKYILNRIIQKIKDKFEEKQLENKKNPILVITFEDFLFEGLFLGLKNYLESNKDFCEKVKKQINGTYLLGVYIYQQNINNGCFIINDSKSTPELINIINLFKKGWIL